MAYEVIKRVSGRAYRYRVESFRDPETRRVRGRWTYLGRVDPADAGLPERPPKVSSRDRLIDAVARLLADHDAESLSAGSIAREAGVAYGTFYRHFTDRAHAVRETLLRRAPSLGDVDGRFTGEVRSRADERARISAWIRDAAESALRDRGLVRAWHVYSNADDAVVAARQPTSSSPPIWSASTRRRSRRSSRRASRPMPSSRWSSRSGGTARSRARSARRNSTASSRSPTT